MPFDEELAILQRSGSAYDGVDLTKKNWLAIKVFNLVFEGETPIHDTAIYFPDNDILFRRVSVVGNLCPALKRPGLTPISVEVSIPADGIELSDEALLHKILSDLRGIATFSSLGNLIDHAVLDIPNAYPLQLNGINEQMSNIRETLKKQNIYHCGRNGTFSYCNSDKAFLQGKMAIEALSSANMPASTVG